LFHVTIEEKPDEILRKIIGAKVSAVKVGKQYWKTKTWGHISLINILLELTYSAGLLRKIPGKSREHNKKLFLHWVLLFIDTLTLTPGR
jgi:hypothetical protein